MSKFADSPYFLLKDYLREVVAPPNPEYLLPDISNLSPDTLYEDVIWVGGVTNTKTSNPYTDSLKGFPKFDELKDDAILFDHPLGMFVDGVHWNGWYDKSPSVMYHLDDPNGVGVLMRGMEKSIIVDGGSYVDLWAKTEMGFVPVKLKPIYENPIDKKFFRFDEVEIMTLNYDGTTVVYDSDNPVDEPNYDSSFVSIQTYDYTYTNRFASNVGVCSDSRYNNIDDCESNGGSWTYIEPGTEIYIRKDSHFHDWLKRDSFAKNFYRDVFEVDFITRNYVNTDKMFLYFGKIYPSPSDDTTTNRYHIEFYGLKDWIQSAIPPNNRKELFVEFLDTYFDMVYGEGYQQLKDIWSLRDAMECNKTFLGYVPTFYGIPIYDDIPEWFTDIYREYSRDVVLLLKRKGTYASMHIIKDLFCNNTKNIFNVMERWYKEEDVVQVDDQWYNYYDSEVSSLDWSGWGDDTNYTFVLPWNITLRGQTFTHFEISSNGSLVLLDSNRYSLLNDNPEPINDLLDGSDYTDPMFLISHDDLSGFYGYRHVRVGDTDDDGKVHTEESLLIYYDCVTYEDHEILSYRNRFQFLLFPDGNCQWNFKEMLFNFFDESMYSGFIWNPKNIRADVGFELRNGSYFMNSGDTVSLYKDHIAIGLYGESEPNNNIGAGDFWYQKYDTSKYPDGYPSTTGYKLSPYYRSDLDLSVEPLTVNKIMPKQVVENLYYNWEMMRPVNRQAEYNLLYSPYCDLTGEEFTLYDPPNTGQSITSGQKNVTFDDDSFIKVFSDAGPVWTVSHTLGTDNVIVTCWDSDFNKMIPDSIKIEDESTVIVTNNESIVGLVVVTKSSRVGNYNPITWNIIHGFNRQEVIVQFRTVNTNPDLDGIVEYPTDVEIVTKDLIRVGGLDPESDYEAFVLNGLDDGESIDVGGDVLDDLIWTFTGSNTVWDIEHGYPENVFMVNCYDGDNKLITPSDIDVDQLDSNGKPKIVVTFDKPVVDGFASISHIGDIVSFDGVIPRTPDGNVSPVEWRLTIETEEGVNTFLQQDGSDSDRFVKYPLPVTFWDGSNNNKTFVHGKTDLNEEDEFFVYYTFTVTDEALRQLGIKSYDILGIELSNDKIRRNYKQRIVYSKISGIHKPEGVNFIGHFRVYKDPNGLNGSILYDEFFDPLIDENGKILYSE